MTTAAAHIPTNGRAIVKLRDGGVYDVERAELRDGFLVAYGRLRRGPARASRWYIWSPSSVAWARHEPGQLAQ